MGGGGGARGGGTGRSNRAGPPRHVAARAGRPAPATLVLAPTPPPLLRDRGPSGLAHPPALPVPPRLRSRLHPPPSARAGAPLRGVRRRGGAGAEPPLSALPLSFTPGGRGGSAEERDGTGRGGGVPGSFARAAPAAGGTRGELGQSPQRQRRGGLAAVTHAYGATQPRAANRVFGELLKLLENL